MYRFWNLTKEEEMHKNKRLQFSDCVNMNKDPGSNT